jgi:hypothetical protein
VAIKCTSQEHAEREAQKLLDAGAHRPAAVSTLKFEGGRPIEIWWAVKDHADLDTVPGLLETLHMLAPSEKYQRR